MTLEGISGDSRKSTKNNDNLQTSQLSTKIRTLFSNITVEPILFCFLLPSIMASLAIANLDLEKSCRVNLKLNESICDGLTVRDSSKYNETDEVAVQKLVATMIAWKNVIKSVFPSILLLFLGSWADRRRSTKPCMLLPITGEIMTCIGAILCLYFFYELPMEITGIMETLPTALTGGWSTLFMAIFSYISVITNEKTRTVRIGALHILMSVSITVGYSIGGTLSALVSLYWVFLIAILIQSIAFIYTCLRIKENKQHFKDFDKSLNEVALIRDLFHVKHVSNTLKITFKPRQKNWRKRICVIMLLVTLVIGPLHGELTVVYLFTRYKFGWDVLDFSIYNTYNVMIHLLGTIFSLTFFSKYLKFDDAILGTISCSSKVLASFLYAFAPSGTIFYTAVLVEMLNGTSFIALRSIISKLVPPEEIGKVNSVFGVVESLMPLVYGPMYSLIYKATIDKFPGTFYLVGGGLTIPAALMFFWLYLQHKRDLREEELCRAQEQELLAYKENGKS